MRMPSCFTVLAILGALFAGVAFAGDGNETLMLAEPSLGPDSIAFLYDGDIWLTGIGGGEARRLTSAPGDEESPVISDDGEWIAFTANYDGNRDVYVMPARGGRPRRLTWHPGDDIVLGFTPDRSSVLFRSARAVFTRRHTELFTVPVTGGFPKKLEIPNAHRASYSPDGTRLAYQPLAERCNQWKHYRGGTVARIWLYDFSSHEVVEIPQPKGRCNDTHPMWVEDKVYFRSDRNGEFNLFVYDVDQRTLEQLTHHQDFPVLNPAASLTGIVYEQAGRLHVFDLLVRQQRTLSVSVPAELRETRPRFVSSARLIRNADVSPSGARAVFEYRGEIVTVPAKKGDDRNLTRSPAVHERSPAWSPDGKHLAYFSDASGEYDLHVASPDGKGEPKVYKLDGAGYYISPGWSPDSKKIAYVDNAMNLFWIDLETGRITKVGTEYLYGPSRARRIRFDWSPDSRWLTYTLNSQTYIRKVYVYSLDENRSHAITDGLSDVSEPVFDAGGDYIYFLGSTDAGPVRQWFDQSSIDMAMTSSIYLAVLRKDLPNPLAKESDEEAPARAEKKEKKRKGAKEETEAAPLRIDFEGLDQRILALPLSPANYAGLQAGNAGEVHFLERSGRRGGPGELKRFSLEDRKAETVASDVLAYRLTPDRKKLLYSARRAWYIDSARKVKPGGGKLAVDRIRVRIDPRAEWKQIYDEAWRINRDYFYATNYHGVNWGAMREKYARFLPHLATRRDLNRVIQWLCSELSVGHHRVSGGDRLEEAERIPGGLLGADYAVENGRYRFAKIYGGLNWNPDLRSPLTEPGVDVQAGEYLLAVNGRSLTASENLYGRFEHTSGRIVEITVGPSPDGTNRRTLSVVPVANERSLRNRDWVEANLRKVDAATHGRVAYVYVPNTAGSGHAYFKRYFFPQAHKEAIIVDERFNGGGLVADYYIDHLRKPLIAYWAMRYGADLKTPSASIQGPKVMIINETAGSGGDLLPWMFRKFKLGPLVGKRTWGGLVGTLGFPVLMDGGRVTAPNLAIWTEEGGFEVENVGVPPDIKVEQWPKDVIAGRDPQLEKAIEVVMAALEKNPPKTPKRPPFPIRNPPTRP